MYRKHFDTVGVFHYSTGLMDSATVFTTGTITVDKPLRVNNAINGVIAEHQGNSDNTQPSSGTCVFNGTPQATVNESSGVTYSFGATPILASFELFDTAHANHVDFEQSPSMEQQHQTVLVGLLLLLVVQVVKSLIILKPTLSAIFWALV